MPREVRDTALDKRIAPRQRGYPEVCSQYRVHSSVCANRLLLDPPAIGTPWRRDEKPREPTSPAACEALPLRPLPGQSRFSCRACSQGPSPVEQSPDSEGVPSPTAALRNQ